MGKVALEQKGGKQRDLSGLPSVVIKALSVLSSSLAILYVSNITQYFGLYVMRHTYLGIMLALILAVAFLRFPASRGRRHGKVPWYDYLFVAGSVAGPIYYAIVFPSEMMRLDASLLTPVEMILTLASVITILEATRRVMGLAMPLIAAFFFIHGLTCNWWPSFFHGRGYDLSRITTQAYLSHFGVFGIAFDVAATIIIIYVMFGRFLNLSGAGGFINAFAASILGGVRGGPAKIAVGASGLFGSISGLATANIATTGSFTIPMMKKMGFRPEYAAAVEAAASNGGQILPPVMGLIAFLMADWIGEPYYKICLAALIPALLYYLCIFVAVDSEAALHGLKGLPKGELPSFRSTVIGGWEFVVPPVGLVLFIGILANSPQVAGLYACILAIIVALFRNKNRRSITMRTIVGCLGDATTDTLMPACACACVGIIMGSLGLTGLGVRLSAAIVDLSGGVMILLLLLSALCSFILGMGVGMIPSYMIVAATVAPALVKLGVPEISAHLFVFYFAIVSMLTPPVAVAAFVAAGIANSDPWRTGWIATRLGMVKYVVPFVFIYSPALVFQGDIWKILVTGTFAGAGVVLLAWTFAGHTIREKLRFWERVICGAGSACFFFPVWYLNIAALLIAVPFILGDRAPWRRGVHPGSGFSVNRGSANARK